MSYVVGNRSCCDNGNRVVGSTYVDECHEHGDAHLATTLAIDTACEELDNIIYATIVTDDGEHSASKDCDDDKLSHSHHSCVHGSEPAEYVECSFAYSDDTCEHYAYDEYEKYVDSTYCRDDDNEVGKNPDEVNVCNHACGVNIHSDEVIDDEHDDGNWCYDAHVDLEFVAHVAALCLCGNDGGVADE